jgi:RND family efflux transporter MFP subunit
MRAEHLKKQATFDRSTMRRAAAALGCALIAAAATPAARAGEFDCVIEPRQIIELRAPLEGMIDKVNVDRGDIVKQDQVLVVLDTAVDRATEAIAEQRSQMRGAILSGQSRVAFSAAKLERANNLHGQNYVSAQARDEAATEKKLAESELRDAEDNRRLAELELKRQREIIRLKTIRSPVDGVVVERMLNPGEFAEAGVGRKPILKLAEIDRLHVEVLLPVEAYGRVKRGMEVELVPEIPVGARYIAKVAVIDRLVDAASGTFGVRLLLNNRDHRLPAGIRCKANFPGIDDAAARRSAARAADMQVRRAVDRNRRAQ